MTRTEKYSWLSLAATVAIYWYFQMRMLDGWSIAEQNPMRLFWIYVTVVVMSIIAEGAIAGGLAVRKAGVDSDERDAAIDAKASRNEHWFIVVAINVAVIHLLAGAAYPGDMAVTLPLTSTASVFFVLFSILYAGHAVKLVSTIVYYRL